MPLAVVDLEVVGEPAGMQATFKFGALVSVIEPDTGYVHYAKYKECWSELSKVRVLLPDVELQQLDTPDGGRVAFTVEETITERTEYKINAQHYESGGYQEKRIECYPDGSWQEIPNY